MKIIVGGDEKVNRRAVEDKKVDMLLSPEKGAKKDFMHSRNSGLNQVLAKLAHKNNVAIGFSFDDVLNSCGLIRARILGRMMQNVILCRKYKVKMIIVNSKLNQREEGDLKSFGVCLGMSLGDVVVLCV